ncbi:MAG TPA: LysR substrate-binding domain-containing protein [Magnetospirillum sp.]|nr:LysR substrate-binding domain-containing protein [Magnetospirillum sp.]
MELRHLRYFVAVAEERHFGRAAERLRMAQPPLSQQIQTFEGELGTRLFDRNRRKVELTAAGTALLDEARDILARAADLGRLARAAAGGEAGRLDIAFTGSVPFTEVMPRILRAFRHHYPDVRVSLREMSTGSQIEAVSEGRLDIGFARPADSNLPHGITAHRILREDLVLALPADHALAGQPRLSMTQVAGEGLVMNPRHIGTGLYDKIAQLCGRAGFAPRIAVEAHQMSTMIRLVGAGLGLAVVPQTMCRVGFDGVAYAAIDDPEAFIDLLVIYRSGGETAVIRNFLTTVESNT